MDYLYIKDLKLTTVIGTHTWERQIKQTVVLNLELGIDIAQVAQNNDLQAGVDYTAVAESIKSFVEGSDFLLLESLAEAVCQLILQHFKVAHVKLDLAKPGAVPQAKTVGLVLVRPK